VYSNDYVQQTTMKVKKKKIKKKRQKFKAGWSMVHDLSG
jgi:hypothetical protein